MNYCRKCQSDYEQAGTCNCFAPALPPQQTMPVTPIAVPAPPTTWPWAPPYVPWSPWGITTGGVAYGPENGTTIIWNSESSAGTYGDGSPVRLHFVPGYLMGGNTSHMIDQ